MVPTLPLLSCMSPVSVKESPERKKTKEKESTGYYRGVFRTDSNIKLEIFTKSVNPLSVRPTKWSNTLKQFVGKLPTNCLSVCDHFVGLALKGLTTQSWILTGFWINLSIPQLEYLECLRNGELIPIFHEKHESFSYYHMILKFIGWFNPFAPNAPFQGIDKVCIGNKWVNSCHLYSSRQIKQEQIN